MDNRGDFFKICLGIVDISKDKENGKKKKEKSHYKILKT